MDTSNVNEFSPDQVSVSQQNSSKNNFPFKFIFFLSIFFIIIIVLSGGKDSSDQSEQNKESWFSSFPTLPPSPTPIRNICNRNEVQYLPAFIDITPAIYITRTVEKKDDK